jgi:hypothetical protein
VRVRVEFDGAVEIRQRILVFPHPMVGLAATGNGPVQMVRVEFDGAVEIR